ncbi:MAG: thioredoxin [Sulfurovum sp. PC08-66]|nr:MAG: thioredoxin [Sulfurovum sp. PC08-66]KIM12551.1 MAG: thioredoxin [Sulfuricurvum sp. PC08-66]
MAKYKELTSANIDAVISEGVSLVDFWAPWCGPCRMIAPVIEELAAEYEGRANICKVNTDEEQEIAARYGIRSIPTLIFFKNGEIVDQVVGAASKQAFAQKLEAHLKA